LRYRRTALYPSLHPGIAPHVPLVLTLTRKAGGTIVYQLDQDRRTFTRQSDADAPPISSELCKRLHARLVTCDLRLR
jgi:hypothetical protein